MSKYLCYGDIFMISNKMIDEENIDHEKLSSDLNLLYLCNFE